MPPKITAHHSSPIVLKATETVHAKQAVKAAKPAAIFQSNAKAVDRIKSKFEDKAKELDPQDKLGNFEIQDLMSRYNQAETLASNVMKKRDDAANGLIGKI